MENINLVIAENLKRFREQKRLSLDAVSSLSGVSKGMLCQIEKGDVNPTIATMWRISTGLKISITDLISQAEADCDILDILSVQPIQDDNGKCRQYLILPFSNVRRFEIHYLEIQTGGRIDSAPHLPGTQEFLTIFSGTLSVKVDERILAAGSGSAIRFKGDRVHSYENIGTETCRLNAVIYYL